MVPPLGPLKGGGGGYERKMDGEEGGQQSLQARRVWL